MLLIVASILLTATVQAVPYWKERAPAVGERVPPFAFDEVISATGTPPPVAVFSAPGLAGKVVVLEFFGTWCRPCVALVPHMNELVAEAADLPVAFVTVSNEDAATLRDAVKQYGIRSAVVRDADGSTFEDFWVGGVPAVALIDKEGRLAAYTHPSAITRAVLEDVAAGKPVALKPMVTAEGPRNWDFSAGAKATQQKDAPALTATATIEEVDRLSGMVRRSTKTGEITAPGMPARTLFTLGWNIGSRDTEFLTEIPEKKFYNVHVVPPDGSPETALAMFRSLVERTLKVKASIEPREREVYLLTRPADAPPLPAPQGDRNRIVRGPGLYQMRDATMDEFAKEIGRVTDKPVVNRTGMTGRHSFDLQWDISAGSAAFKSALEKLGFKIEKGQAAIDTLVVRSGG